MKSKKFAALSAGLALTLSMGLLAPAMAAGPTGPDAAAAQSVREQLRTDRKAYVLKSLALDDGQAKAFAKVYDAYAGELAELNRQSTRLAVEFIGFGDKPTDAQSKYFVKEYLAVEDAEFKVYRKYHPRIVKAIGQAGAARFLAVERRIRALQEFDHWM
ncbi:hypothetical protein [Paucibacter soli]|uniref:hypothetical protein n=1 Tax=Paucibacter soli TaxID=3133433 RepID=UPI0030A30668